MNGAYSRRQDDGPNGRYANRFEIGHSEFEFVFDFGEHYAERIPHDHNKAHIHTRIVTAPVYAKALLVLLDDTVARHERLFGVIPVREGGRDRRDAT